MEEAAMASATTSGGPRSLPTDDVDIEHFLMHAYKVIPCSKRYRHDWSVCPFAHTGEMAARRDPKLYLPIFCYHSKQRLPCPRGEQCPHAHNLFEYWLHPARYRTELCSFGMGCTRPVCFFAHNESQLRHTGVPGGPQPVVAPPEPLMPSDMGAALACGVAGGPAGGGRGALPQDQLLLSSISDAAIKMQLGDAGMRGGAASVPEHAISDVLPVMGAPPSARTGRGAGAAFGAHAPAGALKSMPLPRLDWPGSHPNSAALHPVFGVGPAGAAAGFGPDLGGLDPAGAAAAIALAQAQMAARAGPADLRPPGGDALRRSISDAGAFGGHPAGASQPLQHSQTLDMAAMLSAASAAMAPAAAAPPPLDALQQQLAAMRLAGAGGDAGGLSALAMPHAARGGPDIAAALAASLQQRQPSPLSAPRSGEASPLSAPLPLSVASVGVGGGFLRAAAGSSRTGSPASGPDALLVVGDESLPLDRLQEQLADAPRGGPRDAGGGGNSAPLPSLGGGPKGNLGREAAAQLLASMPESAVRDLLRVLAAGQQAVSQQTA